MTVFAHRTVKLREIPEAETSVLIIYTGGTFGMVYDDDVLVPFDFERVLDKVPVLKSMSINLTISALKEPVDSSNIGIVYWQSMARMLFDNYAQHDGFVILHGTDTMAYTASALSFMLDGLNKPVIMTGAQIPIGATRSDARENLITALEIASAKENGIALVQEVCIYFDFKLIRGNRARKTSSNNFDAFSSENYPVLAHAGVEIAYNKTFLHRPGRNELRLFPEMCSDVSILKVFPEMPKAYYESVLNIYQMRAVVIESFGSGNVMAQEYLMKLLKMKIEDGLIVLNVSQCVGGRVVQDRYKTGRQLAEIGVVSGHDMTTEAALTKLMHLLSNNESLEDVKISLSRSLRGEITPLL